MVERTGPNDARRQSDLDLGFKTERDDRFRVHLVVILTEAEAQQAIGRGLELGYKRENPNWSWTEHEKRDAIQTWVAQLIKEDLKA